MSPKRSSPARRLPTGWSRRMRPPSGHASETGRANVAALTQDQAYLAEFMSSCSCTAGWTIGHATYNADKKTAAGTVRDFATIRHLVCSGPTVCVARYVAPCKASKTTMVTPVNMANQSSRPRRAPGCRSVQSGRENILLRSTARLDSHFLQTVRRRRPATDWNL